MTRRVLVLEDDDSLRFVISKALSRAGFDVRATASPDVAVERMIRKEADALVADVLLGRENFLDRLEELARLRPDAPVVVMSAQTTAATALGAARHGAYEYLPKPFNLDELVEVLERALKVSGASPSARAAGDGLIGRAPAMQEAFQALARLARGRTPVLITGPEGSGRAASGRWLHRQAGSGPLVEAGPDRARREGPALLDAAAGGALLMRRAEHWTPDTAAWVLEALEIPPADAPRLIVTAAPDVRTHLPGILVERLSAGFVTLPPVRQRGDDRARLFAFFLERGGEGGWSLSPAGADFVNAQPWEGEVLQIERTAQRIRAQGPRGEAGPDVIARAMTGPVPPGAREALEDAALGFLAESWAAGDDAPARLLLEAAERAALKAALEASGGVRQEAARRLGMNRNTFARRLGALGLDDGAD
ncbi:response regulator [Alkalicaulis satelles]|uniref:DNA-binding transcriptional regulator NtrC n=1 Tax=Alkalicaulis satelles TaxID=2609175 RepID=A0A5M6ZIZ3_9PROT|nr:response regulator [Alkalicaulis satelles]KAA5804786.1 response regulator [Alkalicaulis satelles]